MPTRAQLGSRLARKEQTVKTEPLRARIGRLVRKPRPSLVALIDSLPPGKRTKADIDREFEKLRGFLGTRTRTARGRSTKRGR